MKTFAFLLFLQKIAHVFNCFVQKLDVVCEDTNNGGLIS
jgi:hypothetical protein